MHVKRSVNFGRDIEKSLAERGRQLAAEKEPNGIKDEPKAKAPEENGPSGVLKRERR